MHACSSLVFIRFAANLFGFKSSLSRHEFDQTRLINTPFNNHCFLFVSQQPHPTAVDPTKPKQVVGALTHPIFLLNYFVNAFCDCFTWLLHKLTSIDPSKLLNENPNNYFGLFCCGMQLFIIYLDISIRSFAVESHSSHCGFHLAFIWQLFVSRRTNSSRKLVYSQKPGRWNAMHVRIAWEILHHQKKENPEKSSAAPGIAQKSSTDMHRPPSHIFPSSSVLPRPHEMPSSFPQGMQGRPAYDPNTMPSSFLTGPTSHLGK